VGCRAGFVCGGCCVLGYGACCFGRALFASRYVDGGRASSLGAICCEWAVVITQTTEKVSVIRSAALTDRSGDPTTRLRGGQVNADRLELSNELRISIRETRKHVGIQEEAS